MAVAIAPVGLARWQDVSVQRVVAIGDADGGARATAEALAGALGATVAPVANEEADLLVVDSRPGGRARSGCRSAPRRRTWSRSPPARCWSFRAAWP